MKKLQQWVVDFLAKEDGPTAVEYAVMLALIIVVCLTAITTIGTNASKTFSGVGSAISSSRVLHLWGARSPGTSPVFPFHKGRRAMKKLQQWVVDFLAKED